VSAQPKAVADTIKSEKDLKASLEAVASSATGKVKTDLKKILSEQFIDQPTGRIIRWGKCAVRIDCTKTVLAQVLAALTAAGVTATVEDA
jgi:hypothetical protein